MLLRGFEQRRPPGSPRPYTRVDREHRLRRARPSRRYIVGAEKAHTTRLQLLVIAALRLTWRLRGRLWCLNTGCERALSGRCAALPQRPAATCALRVGNRPQAIRPPGRISAASSCQFYEQKKRICFQLLRSRHFAPWRRWRRLQTMPPPRPGDRARAAEYCFHLTLSPEGLPGGSLFGAPWRRAAPRQASGRHLRCWLG